MRAPGSFPGCFLLLFFLVSAGRADDAPKLPGPGLKIPVNVDSDGKPTFGDLYAFNYWLELGGSLTSAMSRAKFEGGIIDLSAFFLSGAAALSPSAPGPLAGSGGGGAPNSHIDFTRRMPQNPVPDKLSKQGRITPNGQFVVMSSLANLDGSGVNTVCQIFRLNIDESDVGSIDLLSKTTGGAKATKNCFHPSVSDDGRVIVFDTTDPLDPVLDQNNWADVYIRDLRGAAPVTRLISKSVSTGLAGNGPSEFPSISGNGNVVAFTSRATNLTPDSVSGQGDVFRVGTNGAPQMQWVSRSDILTDPPASGAMRTTDPTLDTVGDVIDRAGNLIVFQGAPLTWTFLWIVKHLHPAGFCPQHDDSADFRCQYPRLSHCGDRRGFSKAEHQREWVHDRFQLESDEL